MFKGSWVALVTPFDKNGEIDFKSLSSLIEWHVKAGTAGLVMAGTTGESSSLSNAEIKQLVEFTLEKVESRLPVVVGNGAISTQKSIDLTQALNSYDIRGFLTVTPYYVKPSQNGLIEHFKAVSDAAQHPVLLYNVPSRTSCDLTNDSVFKLASHENIVGIKDATGDLTRGKELIEGLDGQLAVLSGDDATFQQLMALGASGVISVTANVVPEIMANICQLVIDKEIVKAKELDQSLQSLHRNLFVEANPIPVKWALAEMKKIINTLRLPMTPFSSDLGQKELKAAMHTLALFGEEK